MTESELVTPEGSNELAFICKLRVTTLSHPAKLVKVWVAELLSEV